MRTLVWAALGAVWVSILAGSGRAALGAPLVLTDLMDPALDRGKIRTVLTRETGVGLRLEPPPPELLDSLGVLPPPGMLERCDQEGAALMRQHLGLLKERRQEPITFYQLFGLEQELVDVRLLELDLEAVDAHVQAAWKLVPCLERTLQPEEVRALFLAEAVSQVVRGSSQAEPRLLELMGAAPGVGLEADAPPKVQRAFARVLPLASRQRTRTLLLGDLSSSMWIDGRLVEGPVQLMPGRHIVQVKGVGRLVRTRVLTVSGSTGKSSAASRPLDPIVIEPLFQERPWTDLQAARRALEQALATGTPGLSYQGVLEGWLERQGRTEAAFAVSSLDALALNGANTPLVRVFRRGRGLIPLQEVLNLNPSEGSASAQKAQEDPPVSEAREASDAGAVAAVPPEPAVTEPAVQKPAGLKPTVAGSAVAESALAESALAESALAESAVSPAAGIERKTSSPASEEPAVGDVTPGEVQGAAGLIQDIPDAPRQRRPSGPPKQEERAQVSRAEAGAAPAGDLFGAPLLSAGLRVDVPRLLGAGAIMHQGGVGIQLGGTLPAGPGLLLASASFLLVRPGVNDGTAEGCDPAAQSQEVSQAQAELLASCLPAGSVYALEVGAGGAIPLWESLELVPSVRGMVLSVPGLLLPGAEGAPAWTLFRSMAGGGRLVLGARWQGERVGLSLEVGLAGLLVPAGEDQRWLGLVSVTPGMEVLF